MSGKGRPMNTKNNCIRTEKTNTVLRPYEKCLTLGAETLSDAELLAVILRTGVSGMNSIELAQHIFSVCCRSKGTLCTLDDNPSYAACRRKGVTHQ